MTGQPPVTNVPSTDVPSVKKNMALAALCLTIVASLLIILGFFLAGKAGAAALSNLDVAAAQAADTKRLIFLALASILNLVAFILGLIALIKSRPKTMPLIIFLVVIFLPSIATGIGTAIQNSMVHL
ncbi:hypothetical protein [Varibaculum cambriense]|uniref:hypothetical protein n=1 Tax=Varibaculum cambriense TaxID=184870 RepID=UPI00290298EF|nr:hypothetical protein [Varibaculum cambriense]MDU1224812.1 hypothetical protein [Varibaculum cambriense]